VLSPERREILALRIRERSLAWAIAYATVEEIDSINILRASLPAMQRAVEQLSLLPQEVLVDGLYCPMSRCRRAQSWAIHARHLRCLDPRQDRT
jgi:ribonuclease HII